MRTFATTLLLLGAGAAYAQTFEVASIKPASPQAEGRMMVRMGGDPGRLDYVNVSLRDLVRTAYGVKDYQVSGPDWMNGARFDVQAKYPPDTAAEVRNVMLQNLLAERFGMKTHKESKEAPVYHLIVGKNGPKLKKAEALPAPPPGEVPGPGTTDRRIEGPGGPAGGGTVGGMAGGVRMTGPGGAPVPRPGGPGMIMMRMGSGAGTMALSAKAISISTLADMLARQIGKPIVDQTGITGNFDVDLEFKPEPGGGMMRGMPVPMGHGDPAGSGPAPEQVEGASIFTAIQDQLGLKLEAKKAPVETIVVDQVSKTPTEN